MRAATLALAALEVAVRRTGAALTRRQLVGVHAETHRAARLPPLEAGFEQNSVQALFLSLPLDQTRTRHHQSLHAIGNLTTLGDGRGRANVLDPAVGAGPDEDYVDRQVLHRLAR